MKMLGEPQGATSGGISGGNPNIRQDEILGASLGEIPGKPLEANFVSQVGFIYIWTKPYLKKSESHDFLENSQFLEGK